MRFAAIDNTREREIVRASSWEEAAEEARSRGLAFPVHLDRLADDSRATVRADGEVIITREGGRR